MRNITTGLLIALALLCLAGCGKSKWQLNREGMAQGVCEYLEKNFDALDHDGNGIIDMVELNRAEREAFRRSRSKAAGAEFEKALLDHIMLNIELIGHVTGSTSGHYQYGISRQDVKNWPTKLYQ